MGWFPPTLKFDKAGNACQGQCFCLLQTFLNYRWKKFYNICPEKIGIKFIECWEYISAKCSFKYSWSSQMQISWEFFLDFLRKYFRKLFSRNFFWVKELKNHSYCREKSVCCSKVFFISDTSCVSYNIWLTMIVSRHLFL
jgi:hypothetical protein